MSEADLMREIQLEASKYGARLLRNNVACAWVGDKIERVGGRLLIHDPRPLHAGLFVGSSDLIGWTRRQTENGPVGVFTAIEVKVKNRKMTLEQSNFIEAVKRDGGIAKCAHSVQEAIDAITGTERE